MGLFIFGVFLSFGIIAHYCSGARWPTGELFLRNITLWYAGPWTLAVAAVQAGGLGMVALGLARLLASRLTNIISRTIAPLIYVPSITTSFGAAALGEVTTAANAGRAGVSETCGLGDINQTFYFSPAALSAFIWDVSPSFNLPTTTHHVIGSGKFSIGPGAVGLVMPKPWVIGLLARQLFSLAGPKGRADVNQTLLRPFVNYNMPDGWYLASSPVITANWSANGSQRWNVPIEGGLGKIFKIEGQPINPSS